MCRSFYRRLRCFALPATPFIITIMASRVSVNALHVELYAGLLVGYVRDVWLEDKLGEKNNFTQSRKREDPLS